MNESTSNIEFDVYVEIVAEEMIFLYVLAEYQKEKLLCVVKVKSKSLTVLLLLFMLNTAPDIT